MRIYYWFVGHTSRYSYWSHSRLAKRIHLWTGVEKTPPSATSEEWGIYKHNNKHKIGYWITDTLFHKLQDIWMFIPDVYDNVRLKLENRFITQAYMLDTKLNKYEWQEYETRVMNGLMESMVDFVENEQAHMTNMGKCKADKVKLPSREVGLEHLDWAASLTDEWGENEGQPSFQAIHAKELKEIYLWWKDIRPNRKDPMEESGLHDYYDRQRDAGRCMFDFDPNSEPEPESETAIHDTVSELYHELEQKQEDEDTEMLIRLIKIRKGMWT